MTIVGSKVKLREKQLSDARHDYSWQSDAELARLDAATVLKVSFAIYLVDYTGQLHAPKWSRFPLAVDTLDGKHIGNCSCYDVNESRGETELGIMIGDRDYWNKGYGTDAVNTLVDYVFTNTNLRRIYLKTLDWNLRAQKCFEHCGFTSCRQISRNGHNFVVMELKREHWQKRPKEGLKKV
ncbi:MAG: hypothetical protein A2144_09770 [Chloroflexi bacterium RBG_16_50_9]|nr:MAG: hypothetical protein A2144_09770 [Chloroflexi bacterium RBG_16_50_9]